MPEGASKLVSIQQAAALLACSTDTIRRLIARGEIPSVRVGSKLIRVRRDYIDALIEKAR